jgi:hypothetical protein
VAFPPLSELASERMLERRTVCTHGDGRSLAEHLRWASYRTDQEARRASPWPPERTCSVLLRRLKGPSTEGRIWEGSGRWS